MSIDKYKPLIENLKKYVNQSRLKHSLDAVEVCLRLAEKYKDEELKDKVVIGALLHDCAKDIEIEDYSKYGIKIDEVENFDYYLKNAPHVLHAFASAQFARLKFGLDDPEILKAIESHTMGNEDMSVLDKLIFLGDVIEQNRDFDGVDKIRAMADKDLDKAVLLAMAVKLKHLIDAEQFICVKTIEAWNAEL